MYAIKQMEILTDRSRVFSVVVNTDDHINFVVDCVDEAHADQLVALLNKATAVVMKD